MKEVFDPITNTLNKFAWAMWAILWLSLSIGIGQEDFYPNTVPIKSADTTVLSTISAVLLWSSVILQVIRQIYYSHLGPGLVKVGRWLILVATTIFAFRMTYMLAAYGGAPSSSAALIGVSILAIGLSLNAIGMMQQSYFEGYDSTEKQPKWNNSWRAGIH